jgi:hypothetical protein
MIYRGPFLAFYVRVLSFFLSFHLFAPALWCSPEDDLKLEIMEPFAIEYADDPALFVKNFDLELLTRMLKELEDPEIDQVRGNVISDAIHEGFSNLISKEPINIEKLVSASETMLKALENEKANYFYRIGMVRNVELVFRSVGTKIPDSYAPRMRALSTQVLSLVKNNPENHSDVPGLDESLFSLLRWIPFSQDLVTNEAISLLRQQSELNDRVLRIARMLLEPNGQRDESIPFLPELTRFFSEESPWTTQGRIKQYMLLEMIGIYGNSSHDAARNVAREYRALLSRVTDNEWREMIESEARRSGEGFFSRLAEDQKVQEEWSKLVNQGATAAVVLTDINTLPPIWERMNTLLFDITLEQEDYLFLWATKFPSPAVPWPSALERWGEAGVRLTGRILEHYGSKLRGVGSIDFPNSYSAQSLVGFALNDQRRFRELQNVVGTELMWSLVSNSEVSRREEWLALHSLEALDELAVAPRLPSESIDLRTRRLEQILQAHSKIDWQAQPVDVLERAREVWLRFFNNQDASVGLEDPLLQRLFALRAALPPQSFSESENPLNSAISELQALVKPSP